MKSEFRVIGRQFNGINALNLEDFVLNYENIRNFLFFISIDIYKGLDDRDSSNDFSHCVRSTDGVQYGIEITFFLFKVQMLTIVAKQTTIYF